MKELAEIIKAYDAAKLSRKQSVLATIVHLDGSSYRRPGARMLVLEDGQMIGAISGGCLEGDALKKALLTFTEKKSRLITYDTSDEDDSSIGVQLGCEGVIQVLFEYLDYNNPINTIELLRKAVSKRQNSVLVTLYDLSNKKADQTGACFLQEENGSVQGSLPSFINKESIQKNIDEVFETARSIFTEYKVNEKPLQGFIEFFQMPVSLVVVGAGNDAIPLMQMADILGWDIRVVDGRKTHAKTDRFINACQVLVSKPAAVLEQLPIDHRTCFVLMTHNYQYDLQMLKALLPLSIPYIGVLGPRKKLQKMLDQLSLEGMNVGEEQLSKIYGPTGLDIGAETPEEIASSIISEIQAVLNKKNAQMLKWKSDSIHSNTVN
jgi:xanthine dehydrogenase accessory factor